MNKTPKNGAARIDDHAQEREALKTLIAQYKERLRAGDFERLRLERRLLSMEREQGELSADFVSSQRTLAELIRGLEKLNDAHFLQLLDQVAASKSVSEQQAKQLHHELHAVVAGIEAGIVSQAVAAQEALELHAKSLHDALTVGVAGVKTGIQSHAIASKELSERLATELQGSLRAASSEIEAGILGQVEQLLGERLRLERDHCDAAFQQLETTLLNASQGIGDLVEGGFSAQSQQGEEIVQGVRASLEDVKHELSSSFSRLAAAHEALHGFWGDRLHQEVSGLEQSISAGLVERFRIQEAISKSSTEEVSLRLEVLGAVLSRRFDGNDAFMQRFVERFERHGNAMEAEIFDGLRGRMQQQLSLLDQMVAGQGGHGRGIEKVQDLIEEQQKLVHEVRSDLERMEERELVHTRSQLDEMRKLLADANAQSNRQLDSLRAELHGSRLEREELQHQLAVLHGSASLALGKTVVTSLKTVRGVFALPWRLYKVSKEHLAKPKQEATLPAIEVDAMVASPLANASVLSEAIEAQGFAAAIEFARLPGQRGERAKTLTQVARNRFAADPALAVEIGRLAYEAEPAGYRNRWLAFMEFDAGGLTAPAERLASMSDRADWKPAERRKAAHIEALARWFQQLPEVPERTAVAAVPSATVLYVAASSLPYHHTGYTIRTQSVCKALVDEGWDLHVVTRPGYPADRPDAAGELVASWNVDGVGYGSLQGHGRALPADEAMEEAITALMDAIGRVRPSVVHAASNHENALPALIAARRMGVPFAYEVRGLWELTAASKVPGWEQSERFQLEGRLEALVASEADSLMTLNAPIAQELFERIGKARDVLLVPNAIDPMMIEEVKESVDLPVQVRDGLFLLGYAGSVVGYEGLDDLLIAFSQLLPENPGIRVLIIGSGDALEGLKQLAETLSISDRVAFVGKTSASSARAYLARCDAVVIPRKPLRVCHVVSPLKPLEAMAMKIPVIASDVRAIAEMIDDGRTGLLFRAGDHVDLARVIQRMMSDVALRRLLPDAAFADVINTRTWSKVASVIGSGYDAITSGSARRNRTEADAPVPTVEGTYFPGVEAALVDLPVGRNAFTADEREHFEAGLQDVFDKAGVKGLHVLVEAQAAGRSPKFAAFCAVRAAHAALDGGEADGAVALLAKALASSDDRNTLKAAARMYFGIGRDEEAAGFFKTLADRGELDESSVHLAAQVEGRRDLLALQPARPLPVSVQGPIVVVNFLHFSLPYTSVGYATRSHGIAMGVAAAGWDIRPYTRLGFPQDFKPELEDAEIPSSDVIDGIVYQRIQGAGRKGASETEYLAAAADACEAVLIKESATIVHAASNYTTALPALIAARRLGLPFVYEIRGFWEVTRSSRDAAFERSAKYRTMKFYEDFMLEHSDQIITITGAMREELIDRGVDAGRISLAYNSVDVDRFHAQVRDQELAARLGIPVGVPVVGYVGSFVDYEGLDDLLSAAAMLRERELDFRLLMVGDGAVMDSLREQVEQLQLSEHVILTGRVPHEEVEAHYSLIDVAPFPRKPWEVCELVSPLKPFEAMAMCKPVVVSSTRALLEIVQDGVNGLVFEKGRPEALADALQRLISDAELRSQLGLRARGWVEENRSWARAGADVSATYSRLVNVVDVLPEIGLAGDVLA